MSASHHAAVIKNKKVPYFNYILFTPRSNCHRVPKSDSFRFPLIYLRCLVFPGLVMMTFHWHIHTCGNGNGVSPVCFYLLDLGFADAAHGVLGFRFPSCCLCCCCPCSCSLLPFYFSPSACIIKFAFWYIFFHLSPIGLPSVTSYANVVAQHPVRWLTHVNFYKKKKLR